MSNPYGWSQPTDGQPAVYFAPPGENIRLGRQRVWRVPELHGSVPARAGRTASRTSTDSSAPALEAALGVDDLTDDPPGVVADQPGDEACCVVRLAETAQREPVADRREPLRAE
jgi:hypothetical protein